MAKLVKRGKGVRLVTAEDALNITQLAQYTGYDRRTIHNYIKAGYALEFGNRTTVKHFYAWLRDQAIRKRDTLQIRQNNVLSRLK